MDEKNAVWIGVAEEISGGNEIYLSKISPKNKLRAGSAP